MTQSKVNGHGQMSTKRGPIKQASSSSPRYKCQTPSKTQTENRQRDKRTIGQTPGIEFGAF